MQRRRRRVQLFSESRWRLQTGKKQGFGITLEQKPEKPVGEQQAEYAFPSGCVKAEG